MNDDVFTTADLGPRIAPDDGAVASESSGPTVALTKREQLHSDLKDAIAKKDAKAVRRIERRIERLESEAKAAQRRRVIETELAEEKRVEQRRAKRVAQDAAESLIRATFAPIVLIQYAGRTMKIRLGGKDATERLTADAALERITKFVTVRFEELVTLTRNFAPADAPAVDHSGWPEVAVSRSDMAMQADKFGSIEVEKK